ncbi:hypothetical protein PG993_000160 [Apiospora rasikravindrae]|uniref:Rhodopsin domain-containing protein n=1 Tax=Apiospora rasikravindrae TaxID=990691 RepID=A0ABR1UAG6_9PEZI
MSEIAPAFPPPRNPHDLGRGPMVMGLTWTFTILAIVTTLLRFYVRRRIGPHPAPDDWLMLVAAIFQLVCQVFVTIAFTYGMGKHQADIRVPDEIVPMVMWEWISIVPGLTAGMLGRLSICVLLVRLFGVNKWFRYHAIILTVCGVVANILIIVTVFASRTPVQSLWDQSIPGATQWDPNIVLSLMYIGQGEFHLQLSTTAPLFLSLEPRLIPIAGFYAIADITFVLIPIMFIWKLQTSLERRVGLIALMAMGLFTAALSIMKGIAADPGPSPDGPKSPDQAYEATLELLWATLEQASVVALGNVPALRPLGRLELPVISSLAGSLRRRCSKVFSHMSSKNNRSKCSSEDDQAAGPGSGPREYRDLEMNGNRAPAGHADFWHEVGGTTSTENMVGDGRIHRTDAFTVSSVPAMAKAGSR